MESLFGDPHGFVVAARQLPCVFGEAGRVLDAAMAAQKARVRPAPAASTSSVNVGVTRRAEAPANTSTIRTTQIAATR